MFGHGDLTPRLIGSCARIRGDGQSRHGSTTTLEHHRIRRRHLRRRRLSLEIAQHTEGFCRRDLPLDTGKSGEIIRQGALELDELFLRLGQMDQAGVGSDRLGLGLAESGTGVTQVPEAHGEGLVLAATHVDLATALLQRPEDLAGAGTTAHHRGGQDLLAHPGFVEQAERRQIVGGKGLHPQKEIFVRSAECGPERRLAELAAVGPGDVDAGTMRALDQEVATVGGLDLDAPGSRPALAWLT